MALGALGPVLFFFAGVNVLPMALLAGGGGALALLSLTAAGTWTIVKIIQHARKPAGQFSEYLRGKRSATALDAMRYDNGDTLLIQIVRRGTAEELQEALERGANPNVAKDDGDTPLHYACVCGDLEKVRLLTMYGAAVNAKNGLDQRPIHAAAFALKNTTDAEIIKSLIAIIRFLKGLDADLKAQDKNGKAPEDMVQDHQKQLFQ